MTPMTFMFAPIILIAVAVLGKEIRKNREGMTMDINTAQDRMESNHLEKINALNQQVAELKVQLEKSDT